MKIRRGDVVVIVVILLIAAGLFGLRNIQGASGNRTLRIELAGKVIHESAFDSDSSGRIEVDLGGNAGLATVEIAAGRVRVLPMPRQVCPQGICSKIGWVEQSGDAIVCLPNRLVVTVFGGPANELWDSLDGVTK